MENSILSNPTDYQTTQPMYPKPATQDGNATIKLAEAGYHFVLSPSILDIASDWETAQPSDNIFLHTPYLRALEQNPPQRMRFTYLVFYKKEVPIGVAYCQISNFRPDASIRDISTKDKYPCIIRSFARFFKTFVASHFDHNVLVCGNLLLTGEHGFFFNPIVESKATVFNILEEALILTQKYWEQRSLPIDGIFIKDVKEDHRAPSQVLIERKFKEFTFHPNMIMEIEPHWNSLDDYLADISSKYRVRAKRAFRLASGLEMKEMNFEQMKSYNTRLYELYRSVMDGASFNMTVLHENYLLDLKQWLNNDFRVFGYYENGELVGFRTTIYNYDEIEAHFLGFEQECNKESQLYLNMLFDILKEGIQQKAKRIVFARTAMEIKSSVGAVPHEMYCYIRASNSLTNKMLPSLLEYLRPPAEWIPRNPFK